MKNLYLLLLVFVLGFVSCADDDVDVYDVTTVTDTAESFEALTFDNIKTAYTYPPSEPGATDQVLIVVAFAGAPRAADIPYTITVSDERNVIFDNATIDGSIKAGKLKDSLVYTLELDDLILGSPDQVVLTLSGGDLELGRRTVNLTLGLCPTDLGGEYTATGVGTSTDGCCPDPTTVSADVTIVDNGGANYTISDWSAGLYLDWYGPDGGDYGITEAMETNGTLNGTFTDACDQLSGEFSEPFQTSVTFTGSVDTETGVITYTWVNGYDDTATVTLTPK